MNYSEPLITQVTVFFKALGCGIILGILYDLISIIRMIAGERKSIYIFFDTVYFVLASVVSFFFMVLYNSGQVRLNLMLAELSGAACFHFSLGKYLLIRVESNLRRVRKILSFLLSPFVKIAVKMRSLCGRISARLVIKAAVRKNKEKNTKKFSNIGKILLKNKNKSV